jgi:hypothetical protein
MCSGHERPCLRRGPHGSLRSFETDDTPTSYAVSAWYWPTASDCSRIGGARRWRQVKIAATQRDCGYFLLPSNAQFLRTRRPDWGWQ